MKTPTTQVLKSSIESLIEKAKNNEVSYITTDGKVISLEEATKQDIAVKVKDSFSSLVNEVQKSHNIDLTNKSDILLLIELLSLPQVFKMHKTEGQGNKPPIHKALAFLNGENNEDEPKQKRKYTKKG